MVYWTKILSALLLLLGTCAGKGLRSARRVEEDDVTFSFTIKATGNTKECESGDIEELRDALWGMLGTRLLQEMQRAGDEDVIRFVVTSLDIGEDPEDQNRRRLPNWGGGWGGGHACGGSKHTSCDDNDRERFLVPQSRGLAEVNEEETEADKNVGKNVEKDLQKFVDDKSKSNFCMRGKIKFKISIQGLKSNNGNGNGSNGNNGNGNTRNSFNRNGN